MAIFDTLWGYIAATCGGIVVLTGGIAGINKLAKWVKMKYEKHIERLNESNKVLEILRIFQKEQNVKDEAQKTQLAKIFESLNNINESLESIDLQVGTIQNEKMTWAYIYYGLKQNPISLDTRTSLCRMYEQYTKGGKHNHIPQDFIEVISSAPIDGVD